MTKHRDLMLDMAAVLTAKGYRVARDNEGGGAMVLENDERTRVVFGLSVYEGMEPWQPVAEFIRPEPTPQPEPEVTPEEIVAAWRADNKDEEANHNFEAIEDCNPPTCGKCGDSEGGLLHAFDPAYPPGFFDETIYEVAMQSMNESDGISDEQAFADRIALAAQKPEEDVLGPIDIPAMAAQATATTTEAQEAQ